MLTLFLFAPYTSQPFNGAIFHCYYSVSAFGNLDILFTDKSNLLQPHLEILARYFDKDGPVGIDTMCRTCTVQVRWILLCWLWGLREACSWRLANFNNSICHSLIFDEKVYLSNISIFLLVSNGKWCKSKFKPYRLIWITVQKLTWSGNSVLVWLCSLWETLILSFFFY